VAAMPEGWPQNSDVSDLAQREGLDVLELLLESASEPAPPPLPLSVAFSDELLAHLCHFSAPFRQNRP